MNASAHFVAAQGHDDALDLPPVAKADDVAGVAAFLGAYGGLEAGIVAEAFDQVRGVGKSRPARDEKPVHFA